MSVTNRTAYTFIVVGILILISIGVNALTPGGNPIGTPSEDPGHLISTVDPPNPCPNNYFLRFDGANWVCANAQLRVTGICPAESSIKQINADGSVICEGDDTGGGIFDGSGTANYITKFQDVNTLTSSAIYESAGKIGIGTISPGVDLDIKSPGNPTINIQTTNAVGSRLWLAATSSNGITESQIHFEDRLRVFESTNNLIMEILGSGNVGIGKYPSAKLDVDGNIVASGTICDSVGCIGSGGTPTLSCTRIETPFNAGYDSGFSDPCPAGTIITGGGCQCGSSGVVEYTDPTAPLNQWHCECNVASSLNRAIGICCKIITS